MSFSWSRWVGIIVKEFIQLKRDRLTFGMMVGIPLFQLLLLDEPTAGVDPQARRDFWEEIHALAAKGISVLVATHYMDEAERCHRLAYIAYGKLLATGTPDEVLHLYRLATWEVAGPSGKLAALASALRGKPGVAHVTAFGNTLHVTGEDEQALGRTVREFGDPELRWRESQAGLEDVFIHLMESAKPEEN